MRRPRRYTMIPEVPNVRAPINPARCPFSIVVPLARTNILTNPSVELSTTNYAAVGGSIARTTDQQYHGAYGLAVTPTAGTNSDGVFCGNISLTASTLYAYSCKFKGTVGRQYTISIATTGGVNLTAYTFTATGRWQWVWGFWSETSSTGRRFYIRKNNHNSAAVFYVDGLQIETCTDGILAPSTYIDGDQVGLLPNQFPAPYRWNGTPHASTSTRDVTTRAGGYVMNLDRFAFRLLAYAGLGLTVLSNIAIAGAATDGAAYQATVAQSRQIALKGVFGATTPQQLQRLRSELYSVVGPDSVNPRQPLTLLYQPLDCEREAGNMGHIVASYQSGLEQNATAIPLEEATITFTQWLPTVYGGDAGVALTVQSSVSNVNRIVQRSADGVWSALGTGAASGLVYVLAYGPDGMLYAGGTFTGMGGVANTSRIAYWDGSAWNAMGTGAAGGDVLALAIGADGTVYAGGTFTSMGGVANTDGVAKWNGSAWSAMGTGVSSGTNQVNGLVYGPDGSIYATGFFSAMGGVANTAGIAKWNGSAWSALSTGLGISGGYSLAFGLDGALHVGGSFITAGGGSANNIAKWDGAAFSALGDGTSDDVIKIVIGPNGFLYALGFFTTAGGITVNKVAIWNGTGWSALGSGLDDDAYTGVFSGRLLYVGGDFTVAGGLDLPDSFAAWNGSAWVYSDIDLPGALGAVRVYSIAASPAGVLTVGHNGSGTATAAGVTTVTNTGTARAFPTVRITGPSSGTSRLYQLANITSGKILYLNYTIAAGETVTIRTSGQGTTLVSSVFGDRSGAILPGSSPDFALERGANSISFFSADSSVTAAMRWAIPYQSADDLTD